MPSADHIGGLIVKAIIGDAQLVSLLTGRAAVDVLPENRVLPFVSVLNVKAQHVGNTEEFTNGYLIVASADLACYSTDGAVCGNIAKEIQRVFKDPPSWRGDGGPSMRARIQSAVVVQSTAFRTKDQKTIFAAVPHYDFWIKQYYP